MKNPLFHLTLLGVVLVVCGCRGRGESPLIPTPVLYTDSTIDPFDYLDPNDRSPQVEVFYATNRKRTHREGTYYGNAMDNRVHVGRTVVRLGEEDMTWEALRQASSVAERDEMVPVTLEQVEEHGVLRASLRGKKQRKDESMGDAQFAAAINVALAQRDNKSINIYVHGIRVDFDHGAVLGGQFRHFAMREGVTLAFDWASRQKLLYYLGDVKRARRSVPDLVALLDFLARETDAETISIISWSAGAPLHSAAMVELRQRHPTWTSEQLFEHYRIDEAIFAASDMDFLDFVKQFKAFYDLPRSIMVTICHEDEALVLTRRLYGKSRLGSADLADLADDEIEELARHYADKIDIVDVTRSQEHANVDAGLTGHHYWFNSTWVNTDLLVTIYLDLPPEQRGLTCDNEHKSLWYFDANYPAQVVEAVKDVTGLKNLE
ncbi:alpha/beta hydrolase [Planctomycetota bacterium]